MALKFNPNPSAKKYLAKAGTFDATVQSFEAKYTTRAEYYVKLTFLTKDGELTSGILSAKPDKNGGHSRLNDFIASTATDDEIKKYVDSGEIEVDENFVGMVAERSKGRGLTIEVKEREYTKADGSKGQSFEAVFFRRLPDGPNPF